MIYTHSFNVAMTRNGPNHRTRNLLRGNAAVIKTNPPNANCGTLPASRASRTRGSPFPLCRILLVPPLTQGSCAQPARLHRCSSRIESRTYLRRLRDPLHRCLLFRGESRVDDRIQRYRDFRRKMNLHR